MAIYFNRTNFKPVKSLTGLVYNHSNNSFYSKADDNVVMISAKGWYFSKADTLYVADAKKYVLKNAVEYHCEKCRKYYLYSGSMSTHTTCSMCRPLNKKLWIDKEVAELVPSLRCTEFKMSTKNFGTSPTRSLTISANGDFMVGKQAIKLGRVLSACTLKNSTEIEEEVVKTRAHFLETKDVQISTNVSGVYDMQHPVNNSDLAQSCMRYEGEKMKLYEELGVKVAYLADEYGTLKARCLIWEDYLYDVSDADDNTLPVQFNGYDRIFADSANSREILGKWCRMNGYINMRGSGQDLIYKKSVQHIRISVAPYVDTMCNIDIDGFLNTYDNEGGSLQQQNGTIEHDYFEVCEKNLDNMIYCVDTDEHVDMDDDYYYDEYCQEYYQYDDHLCHVSGWGWYHQDAIGDVIIHDVINDEYIKVDEAIYLKDRDAYTHEDNDYLTCTHCGENFSEDFEEILEINRVCYCYDCITDNLG